MVMKPAANSTTPTIILDTYRHWLSARLSEVERHQESEAWKVLHFTWANSTNELASLIRHIEKELADNNATDERISIDLKQAGRLRTKIDNLAQAICGELTNDETKWSTDTDTDDMA